MKINVWLFDVYVLRRMDIALCITAILMFIQRQWFAGIVILASTGLLAVLGQSMNPGLSTVEYAKYFLDQPTSDGSVEEELFYSTLFGKGLVRFGFIMGIMVTVLAMPKVAWWAAILIGVGIAIIAPLIAIGIVYCLAKWRNRKNRRNDDK
jgi:hypothetical protein